MFSNIVLRRRISPLLRTVRLLQQQASTTSPLATIHEIPREEFTEMLLAPENAQRCMENWNNQPPINLQRKASKKDDKMAAVLIALCVDHKKDLTILYTRRSATISRHVRQVSFPGGIQDPEDRDHFDCALRETEEEIGLDRSRIEVWGSGAPFHPPGMALIQPVVGVVRDFDVTKELTLNNHEVEDVILVPVSSMLQEGALRYTQFKAGYSAPAFHVADNRIWGITAHMTYQFLQCLLPPPLNQHIKNRVRYLRPYRAEEAKK